MKLVRSSWLAVLAVATTLVWAPAHAAENTGTRPNSRPAQGQGQGQEQRRQQMRQERLERLTKELSLTEVQKKKVETLWEKQTAKVRELRSTGQGADRAQLREQMQALRKEMSDAMKKILTTEQFAKYEKLENERVNQLRQRGQGAQRPGGPGGGGGRGAGQGNNR